MSDESPSGNEWIRALGIDYGTVRIGLAVSDELGMFAHPLKTISGNGEDRPDEVIAEIVASRGILDIVIGLPLHTDGSESAMSREVVRFVGKLRSRLGKDFPIHEVDELMTSKIAREKLVASGKSEEEIRRVIDQAAAVEILQDWLNGRAGGGVFSPEDPDW